MREVLSFVLFHGILERVAQHNSAVPKIGLTQITSLRLSLMHSKTEFFVSGIHETFLFRLASGNQPSIPTFSGFSVASCFL